MKIRNWSIKKKIDTITVAIFLAVAGVIFLFSIFVYFPQYTSLEKKSLEDGVVRLHNLIKTELRHLDLFCSDWAYWTDTYRFIQDRNDGYIESNLGPESLEIGGLDFFLFLNREGSIVYEQLRNESFPSFHDMNSEDVAAFLTLPIPADRQDEDIEWGSCGFLRHPEDDEVYLYAARYILKSDVTGPPGGILVAGRQAGDDFLSSLSETLRIEVGIVDIIQGETSGYTTGDDVAYLIEKKGFMELDPWVIWMPFDYSDGRQGYLNFYHEPSIRRQGFRTIMTSTSLFLLAVLSVLVLYYMIINRQLLVPITKLTGYVRKRSLRISDATITSDDGNEIRILSRNYYALLRKQHTKTRMLQFQAERDHLTGLFNRRTLQRNLDLYCEQGVDGRVAEPLGIIMFDIDHFKRINDTYGHTEGGDYVLRTLGSVLISCLRKGDIAGRFGGEEFLVIIPGQPVSVVVEVAERIRRAVESTSWKFPDMRVTVSCGYSWTTVPCNPDTLVTRADKFLYEAKEEGRNRVKG